jgi:hypothetical protein
MIIRTPQKESWFCHGGLCALCVAGTSKLAISNTQRITLLHFVSRRLVYSLDGGWVSDVTSRTCLLSHADSQWLRAMFQKRPGISHACLGRIAPRLACALYRPRLPQSTWKTALGRTYQSCSQDVSLPFGGTMLTLRPGRRIRDSNSEQGESKQHKGLVYEFESSSAAGKRFPAVSTVLKVNASDVEEEKSNSGVKSQPCKPNYTAQDSANKSSQFLLERWRRKEVELKGEEAVAIERKGRLGRGMLCLRTNTHFPCAH